MINRYQGNSGRMTRYEERLEENAPLPPPAAQVNMPRMPAPRRAPMAGLESLSRLLPDKVGELESEDIILMLILYLMYKESGDSDLLIIMGAMFLL